MMNKRGKPMAHFWSGAGLCLILAGCVAHPPAFQATDARLPSETASSDDPANIEEFTSLSVARDEAIAQSDAEESVSEVDADIAELDSGNDTMGFDLDLDPSTGEITPDQEDATPLAADETKPAEIQNKTTVAETNDLWTRVRAGFTLPDKDHKGVETDSHWYMTHQEYLDRTFGRAQPYLYHIVEEVQRRKMPTEIALLPVVESAFQPFAYSHGRASGLWQFIPGTARHFGLKIDWWYDGRRDVYAATDAALDYLQQLSKRFNGDWLLALAAYNSGAGTVNHAIRVNKRKGKGTTFWDLDLPKETRGYVPKLLAIAKIVGDPEAYHVTLKDIPNEPYLAEVDIGSQLDLALAADMADMTLEELYTLNPAFNRWATAPNGPHTLLLPLDKTDAFEEKLAELPADQRVKWIRHKIGEGETLGHIANHYRTTVAALKRINNIHGHMIRAGQHLLIPVASRSATAYALSAEQRLKKKQNTRRGEQKVLYTVRAGDTLWDIAQEYKVSVRQLASWNNMAPRDYLRPGQKLAIWTGRIVTASVAPGNNPALKDFTRKINYRVRNGDSLARISQRFNVTVGALQKWNPDTRHQKYLQPGQHLVVYIDVTQVAENI